MVICAVSCIMFGQHGDLPYNKVAQTYKLTNLQTYSTASERHLLCAAEACGEDRIKKQLFAFVPKY